MIRLGVPEFWLTVLRTHPAVNELITPEDEDALKHLIDVRLSYTDDNHVRPSTAPSVRAYRPRSSPA